MNDSKRASIIARVKALAAVARTRAEVRGGLHHTDSGHEPESAVTVRVSELSGLCHYGGR